MNKVLFWILVSVISVSSAYAKVSRNSLTSQEAILLYCLNINYKGLGIDVNDYSATDFKTQTNSKMIEYVKKNAGYFYTERYAIKTDTGVQPNMIFNRCINFSKSVKTKTFLKKLDVRIL